MIKSKRCGEVKVDDPREYHQKLGMSSIDEEVSNFNLLYIYKLSYHGFG